MTKKQKNHSGRLEDFFDHLGTKADSTLSGYYTNIGTFLKFILGLSDVKKGNLSVYVDQYFDGSPDVCEDFRQFLKEHISKRPALSAKQSFNTLKVFFETVTDTPFSPKQIKSLKNQLPKGSDAASEETYLNQQDIRLILQHCDIKMKAVVLMLATGGMRISDLLEMDINDVKQNTIPVQIVVGNKKTNAKPRTAFITTEALQAVQAWLKVRDVYLNQTAGKALNLTKVSEKKTNSGALIERNVTITVKNTNTTLLFPLSENSVNQAFRDAVIAAFGDNEVDDLTGRSKRHIHGFRKFCSTTMGAAGINQGLVDKIIGHKTALSRAYDNYSVDQLAENYIKAETKLLIEAPEELINNAVRNSDRIEVIREQQGTSQALINRLQLDRMTLEATVQSQGVQMRDQAETLEEMRKMISDMSSQMKMLKATATYHEGDRDLPARVAQEQG
jgi:integrase